MTLPASCRAASGNGSRSLARWRTSRRCCWPTSPPGPSIRWAAMEILELFRRLHSGGQTTLLVTHDERVAQAADRVVWMRDGRIEPRDRAAGRCDLRSMRWRPSGSVCARSARSRWRAWLALAALAGLAGGFVIATATAARRADSAITRWRDATGTMDVWVGKGELWDLEIDFARVERLPQVAGATRSHRSCLLGADGHRPRRLGRRDGAQRRHERGGWGGEAPQDPRGPHARPCPGGRDLRRLQRRASATASMSAARCACASRRGRRSHGSPRPASTTHGRIPRPPAPGRS